MTFDVVWQAIENRFFQQLPDKMNEWRRRERRRRSQQDDDVLGLSNLILEEPTPEFQEGPVTGMPVQVQAPPEHKGLTIVDTSARQPVTKRAAPVPGESSSEEDEAELEPGLRHLPGRSPQLPMMGARHPPIGPPGMLVCAPVPLRMPMSLPGRRLEGRGATGSCSARVYKRLLTTETVVWGLKEVIGAGRVVTPERRIPLPPVSGAVCPYRAVCSPPLAQKRFCGCTGKGGYW